MRQMQRKYRNLLINRHAKQQYTNQKVLYFSDELLFVENNALKGRRNQLFQEMPEVL